MSYTHYDYLELPPGASVARIEAAYIGLVERFGYGTTDAGQDMSGLLRMIHTAYAVLHDPAKRRAYDAALAREAAMADAELKASLDQQLLCVHSRALEASASSDEALTAIAA